MRRTFYSAYAVFILLLCTRPANATELENPNFMPFGEQEAYLGNAGIALEDSSGAVFYNPGALGFVTGRKASVYGNAYAFNKFTSRSSLGEGNPDFVVSSSSYSGVPLSTVTIFAGDDFTYAFSFNTPYSSKKSISAPLAITGFGLNLLVDISEDSLWLGPSVAKKFFEHLGLGASLFLVHDTTVLNEIFTQRVDSTGLKTSTAARAEISNWSMLMVLGAQYRASESWNIGLRVQTPSVDLRGRTDYFIVTQSTTAGQVIDDQSGIHSVFRRPFSFGIGNKYSPFAGADLYLDLNAQLPVHFNTAPSRAQVNSHIDTNFRMRGNFGAKFRLSKTQSLLTGFLYNPSTLPAASNLDVLNTSENFKGVMLGLQKDMGPLTTSMGGFFLWSNATFKSPDTGRLSEYAHRIYGLLLTASYKL